jgi:hypothetical protein
MDPMGLAATTIPATIEPLVKKTGSGSFPHTMTRKRTLTSVSLEDAHWRRDR